MVVFGTLALMGDVMRISAFYFANSNFTHLVAYRKEREHVLVTNGIYKLSRHPSYDGYFLFAVCTQ